MTGNLETDGGAVADGDPTNDAESPGELLTDVLWDGVIGAIAGAGGNVVILTALFVATQFGGFDPASFTVVAEILGLNAVLSGDALLYAGLAVFVIGGLTVFPLLLVTLGSFLPGRRYATRGVVFGAIVWTGFVLAYNAGFQGLDLAVYVVFSFLGHLGYGFATGWLLDRMFAEEGRPVIAESIVAPTARDDRSPDRDASLEDDETPTSR